MNKHLAKVVWWILFPINLVRFIIDMVWLVINYTFVWLNMKLIGRAYGQGYLEIWKDTQLANSETFLEWFFEET